MCTIAFAKYTLELQEDVIALHVIICFTSLRLSYTLGYATFLAFNFWISPNVRSKEIYLNLKVRLSRFRITVLTKLIPSWFSYFSIDVYSRSFKALMLELRAVSSGWVIKFLTMLLKWLLKILAIFFVVVCNPLIS